MKPGLALSSLLILVIAVLALSFGASAPLHPPARDEPRAYVGFDRNIYPGDDALPMLRKTFAFTSYWLSPPPGEKTNTWLGKRGQLHRAGFGFLLLYDGRASREVSIESKARDAGMMDAKNAVESAKNEGFAAGAIIFLDVEEGGRLPAAYHVYLHAWADELARAGYGAGLYCSGIPVVEEGGVSISTAEDIRTNAGPREFTFWIYNDACPPSPGCAFPQNPPVPSASGSSFAAVWQFAQSPRRKERTARCPANYSPDGNCYAPGDTAHKWFLDVNTASSPDPSNGAQP